MDTIFNEINPKWQSFFHYLKRNHYHYGYLNNKIQKIIDNEIIVYPKLKRIHRPLRPDPDNIKFVIIHNKPYRNNNSDGLAFSCKTHEEYDLILFYSCLENELGRLKKSKDLDYLSKQGVLLLNYQWCVTEDDLDDTMGWGFLTTELVIYLSRTYKNLVFLLFDEVGNYLMNKIENKTNHLIINKKWPKQKSDTNFDIIQINNYISTHKNIRIDFNFIKK